MIQTNYVVDRLRQEFPSVKIDVQTTRTLGDRVVDVPLDRFGRTGVFVRDLGDLLRQRRIDLAVHSLKDVPPDEDDDLLLAAFPCREDARDVIVSQDDQSLRSLLAGARVGTSSSRRRAQLRAVRSDLDYRDELRGNVDTRIRKLREGQYDAIVLAAAGLIRLGRQSEISEILPLDLCLPDAGQGTLVVQIRRDDWEAAELVSAIDDPVVRACALAERGLVRAFGGGCSVPVAAFASPVSQDPNAASRQSGSSSKSLPAAHRCDSDVADHARLNQVLELQALVAAPDGSRIVRSRATGPIAGPEALGKTVWHLLEAGGASDVLAGASRG